MSLYSSRGARWPLAHTLGVTLAALGALTACGDEPPATAPRTRPAPALGAGDAFAVTALATTNLWATRAPMPTARSIFGAGVVNGVLYAVGGNDAGGKRLATVHAYTAGSNSWATRAPLPSARGGAGVGAINGVLYAAGGVNASGAATNTLYAYTPSTNTWSTRAPMLAAGGGAATGVIGGKLYVYTAQVFPAPAFQLLVAGS
jgi:N-acetylneuraminic acid mutarotase